MQPINFQIKQTFIPFDKAISKLLDTKHLKQRTISIDNLVHTLASLLCLRNQKQRKMNNLNPQKYIELRAIFKSEKEQNIRAQMVSTRFPLGLIQTSCACS
ncbi:heparan sulfate glucosamine 3-O-sulfotransferase 1 [Platysternon megacephalum]|uniref:Heparan sulfate glucosamine 3-O-sulfotransferase 1 n=1 Tax=Platysternon megacephalum TaxID=55544 RepID=A0A4D9EHI3_9SAUR|nr:heparan sulfate glucosamine 3-O-sulfotransferase 1 [Platysternon megacephalum]